MKTGACEMKGFLSFLLLWIVYSKKVNGAQITDEIEKRRGTKPSPGTIYPALKDLKNKGLIQSDKEKYYSITQKGRKELESGINTFFTIFADMKHMKSCTKELHKCN